MGKFTNTPPMISRRVDEIDTILFDFDGVLVNSLPIMEECWKRVRGRLNLNIPFSDYKKHIGKPFLSVMDKLGIPEELTLMANDIYFSCDARKKIPMIYPGIKDLLESLKGNYLMGIVTSKDYKTTSRWLYQLGLESIFESVQTPELYPKEFGKPNPYFVLKSLINLRTTPNKAIYIGDMGVDKEAATRAGINFLYASWGYGRINDLDDQHILKTPKDIIKFLNGSQR